MEMPVDDPGILVDIDTPEEYNQYLEKLAGFQ
jgi:CTP:molybdopterin cytidylyltransferase MocA